MWPQWLWRTPIGAAQPTPTNSLESRKAFILISLHFAFTLSALAESRELGVRQFACNFDKGLPSRWQPPPLTPHARSIYFVPSALLFFLFFFFICALPLRANSSVNFGFNFSLHLLFLRLEVCG